MDMLPPVTPTVVGLRPSATLAINETCRQLIADGHTVYKLGLGQSPFPVPDHVVKALQDNAHQKAYLSARGLPELCDAVAAHLGRTEGVSRRGEMVLIGPGTKELLFLLQFVYQAELLLPSPGWVSYEPQAAVVGRSYSWLNSDREDWGLCPQALDAHCRSQGARARLLILNYPNNPSGHCYSADELQALAEVCRRHQIVVLSDEIYSGVHFRGEHVSMARYYPEGTIVSNGLSKWAGAGGWRLGWFSFPDELAALHRAMETLITETFTSVNSPVQYAAISALDNHADMAVYLRDSRRVLRALAGHCAEQLRHAGAELADAEGGFYLFPRFHGLKEIEDSAQLCRRLLNEAGVAILPGTDFGRPGGEFSARVAFVDFDGAQALKAAAAVADIDAAFLKQYCEPTVTAMGRLADWLHQTS